jgi:pimeloyl-ACP methyl ester carboxylesterase
MLIFDRRKRLTMFLYTHLDSVKDRQIVLWIGGLGDSMCAVDYLDALSSHVHSLGCTLATIQLSSSANQYGVGSLSQDANEIYDALAYLDRECAVGQVVLVGHSTGCQDLVQLFRKRATDIEVQLKLNVVALVLQAPVSDRLYVEWTSDSDALSDEIALAKRLIAAADDDETSEPLMPRPNLVAGMVPISAERYLSLASRDGDDDLFSADLSDRELAERLEPLRSANARVYCVFSADDEYVPPSVDTGALAKRFEQACGCKSIVLPGVDHALEANASSLAQFLSLFDPIARQAK